MDRTLYRYAGSSKADRFLPKPEFERGVSQSSRERNAISRVNSTTASASTTKSLETGEFWELRTRLTRPSYLPLLVVKSVVRVAASASRQLLGHVLALPAPAYFSWSRLTEVAMR